MIPVSRQWLKQFPLVEETLSSLDSVVKETSFLSLAIESEFPGANIIGLLYDKIAPIQEGAVPIVCCTEDRNERRGRHTTLGLVFAIIDDGNHGMLASGRCTVVLPKPIESCADLQAAFA